MLRKLALMSTLSTILPTTFLIVSKAVADDVDLGAGISVSRLYVPEFTIQINPDESRRADYYLPYQSPRYRAFADINNDGLTDIVFAPSLFSTYPGLPVMIAINTGSGKFQDRTSDYIDGNIPTVGNIVSLFTADFNNDGRSDILMIDSGLEDKPDYDGGLNSLLLSQANGKFVDASGNLPRTQEFNHVSSIADLNGDGNLDVVLTVLWSEKSQNAGIKFLIGRGDGTFIEGTFGLPSEIAYPLPYDDNIDLHDAGSNAATDLDGDGRTDLVTAAYGAGDRLSGQRTVRFYKQTATGAELRGISYIPSELADIPYFPGESATGPGGYGVGAAGVFPGDLDNDGDMDIAVHWESSNETFIQLLRNDGNFHFTDMTFSALGTFSTSNDQTSSLKYKLLDHDGDGRLDILVGWFNMNTQQIHDGDYIWVNDGNWAFHKAMTTYNGQHPSANIIQAALGGCDYCGYAVEFEDVNGDSKRDAILINGNYMGEIYPYRTEFIEIFSILAK